MDADVAFACVLIAHSESSKQQQNIIITGAIKTIPANHFGFENKEIARRDPLYQLDYEYLLLQYAQVSPEYVNVVKQMKKKTNVEQKEG